MNEYHYWQMAQERQRVLLDQARRDQQLREAGYRDPAQSAARAFALLLLALPLAVILVRVLAIS